MVEAKELVRFPRENPTPVTVQQCMDSKGNWTKWVVERLTEDQMAEYAKMVELVNADEQCAELKLAELSDNHKLRFLAGHGFNAEEAVKQMKMAESFLIERNLWDVTGPKDFQNLLDFKAIHKLGKDKEGRTVMLVRPSRFRPE
jgi:hypothetical protein